MPQGWGPNVQYSLSIVLRDHIFKEAPTFVPTGRRIWIYTILEKKSTTVRWGQRWEQLTAHLLRIRVIFTAIRCIDCIKPIVKSGGCVLKYINGNSEIKAELTLNQVSNLQKCDFLRICQAHCILKIKWTLCHILGFAAVSWNRRAWGKFCYCNVSTREDEIMNLHQLRWFQASPRPDLVKSPWKKWFNTHRRYTQTRHIPEELIKIGI